MAIAAAAVAIALSLYCHGQRCSAAVLDRYIQAFNTHDEAKLRAIVADTAHYNGHSKERRLLIDQNVLSWKHPVTSNSVMVVGVYKGEQVIVVWTKPQLQDGVVGPWTRGVLLWPLCGSDKILGMRSQLIIFDKEIQAMVKGEPPQE